MSTIPPARTVAAHGNRVAAVCALLAAAAVITNAALMLAAVDLDIARLHAFGKLYDAGASGARLLVASTIADAAFYLLLAPVAVGLSRALAAPFGATAAQLGGGLAYAVTGAAGALWLTLTWPSLFSSVAAGDVDAAARFELTTTLVFRTVWHQVGATAGAVWWLSAAAAAHRVKRRAVAAISAALGLACALQLVATTAGLETIATFVLDIYLGLLPLWAIIVGAALWRARDGARGFAS